MSEIITTITPFIYIWFVLITALLALLICKLI